MTLEVNQQASVVARYEDAKATAGQLGLQLTVTRIRGGGFVLADTSEAVRSFADIAHVEHFLRGMQMERDAKVLARSRSRT
ncbi:MAG: hypothetical protein ABS36_08670 [Acidobacteria bacterium SCN 69-37]|nr:MAG: hypothetical protein ABS36_08670 [Acidobacteria bacterium SCN 69-37]